MDILKLFLTIKFTPHFPSKGGENKDRFMRLFASYRNSKNKNFHTVELHYSVLYFIGGNNVRWFCRIWHKDWLKMVMAGKKEYGESYGKTKFDAYRKAHKDLLTPHLKVILKQI